MKLPLKNKIDLADLSKQLNGIERVPALIGLLVTGGVGHEQMAV